MSTEDELLDLQQQLLRAGAAVPPLDTLRAFLRLVSTHQGCSDARPLACRP
jgi:hypothetical protein